MDTELKKKKHVFSVAAYGESPYLETLLRSLRAQTIPGPVILCTSTPNDFIRNLSEKYEIPLRIREGAHGLQADWNFAYEKGAEIADLVTIAHQDDLYYPDYRKALLFAWKKYPDLSVFCCRYDTIDASGEKISGKAENVKRILRLPLRDHRISDRTWVKRAALSFGNGIGCPTCTYNTALCGDPLFRKDYKFVIDWDTLLRLSGCPGRFICLEKPLMAYRVHAGAETAVQIGNHNREKEETEIFTELWGRIPAKVLMHFYRKAYSAYDIGKAGEEN